MKYKYDFPLHHNNYIFAQQLIYNYFISAYKCTLLGTYDEFVIGFPFNEIKAKIPMGYRVLVLLERVTIISKNQ